MGHKSKYHKKSESTLVVKVKKSNHTQNNGCDCVQNYYMPLPALDMRTSMEQVTPLAWMRPGLVQGSCTQCSSVRPVYATPCTGYCCKN